MTHLFQLEYDNSLLIPTDKVAIPIIQEKIQDLDIPDVSGSAKTPVGHVDYSLTDIKVTRKPSYLSLAGI